MIIYQLTTEDINAFLDHETRDINSLMGALDSVNAQVGTVQREILSQTGGKQNETKTTQKDDAVPDNGDDRKAVDSKKDEEPKVLSKVQIQKLENTAMKFRVSGGDKQVFKDIKEEFGVDTLRDIHPKDFDVVIERLKVNEEEK